MMWFSAAISISDYTSLSSVELFVAGSTDTATRCVNITILDDTALEGDQTFILALFTSDPNVLLGNDMTLITIEDNDSVLTNK